MYAPHEIYDTSPIHNYLTPQSSIPDAHSTFPYHTHFNSIPAININISIPDPLERVFPVACREMHAIRLAEAINSFQQSQRSLTSSSIGQWGNALPALSLSPHLSHSLLASLFFFYPVSSSCSSSYLACNKLLQTLCTRLPLHERI